jgi:hypothetical protein
VLLQLLLLTPSAPVYTSALEYAPFLSCYHKHIHEFSPLPAVLLSSASSEASGAAAAAASSASTNAAPQKRPSLRAEVRSACSASSTSYSSSCEKLCLQSQNKGCHAALLFRSHKRISAAAFTLAARAALTFSTPALCA